MGVGQHERLVYTRERLVLRVFQQARGANGKRIMHAFEERQQVLEQRNGKRGLQKPARDFGIIFAMDGEVQQAVVVEEVIEDFRSQNQRGWYRDANSRNASRDAALPQDMANESQAAGLAAERAAANL